MKHSEEQRNGTYESYELFDSLDATAMLHFATWGCVHARTWKSRSGSVWFLLFLRVVWICFWFAQSIYIPFVLCTRVGLMTHASLLPSILAKISHCTINRMQVPEMPGSYHFQSLQPPEPCIQLQPTKQNGRRMDVETRLELHSFVPGTQTEKHWKASGCEKK